MKENQHIEWKEAWRDEYLKWICGFANAEGGVLDIGRNDKGVVVGLPDAKKLLEDIPNKVRDILGIMVEVNLRTEKGKEYLQIKVEPYPYPVSYKGEYHYRSGSTKQELKGAALGKFLLRKQGRHWDDVPTPHVAIRDLSKSAINAFRKLALGSGRVNTATLKDSTPTLIEKLHLLDGKYLKRAGITYRGIQRVEAFPVPEVALREAVLNAIIHKDYSAGTPIQISVYDDKLMVWNPGELPVDWTVAKLKGKHSSRPFNPDLANAFFQTGMIEAWGRGIERIMDACQAAGTPEPELEYEETGLWVIFSFPPTVPVKTPVKTPERILKMLQANSNVTLAEVAAAMGKSLRAIERASAKLVKEGRLRYVGPRKGGHWEVLT